MILMADRKPINILILCTKFPWPPKDGGTMAMMSMIQGFHKAGNKVTVLTMNTPKHYVTLRTLPSAIQQTAEFIAVDVNTDVKIWDMLANLFFSRESYHVVRFTSKRFREELERLLKARKFDLVQLETLYMAPYISTISKNAADALISLRVHNTENEIWYRRARNEMNPFKKALFMETGKRIRIYEESVMSANKFDILVPITRRDGDRFKKMGAKKNVFFCNAGIDTSSLNTRPVKIEFPSLFYIGALDWEPNKEGLKWFLSQVWPRIHKRYPKVKFYIAGRRMPEKIRRIKMDNVVNLGEVESAEAFIKPRAIMIVPILSGSGMRIKIIEGMAYGKAIVATKMAAEGIGARHGDNILLADDPKDFADCVSVLIEKRSFYDTISRHAQAFIHSRFENDVLIDRLLGVYEKQLKEKRKKEEKE